MTLSPQYLKADPNRTISWLRPKWEVEIIPDGGFVIQSYADPCAFHRWMQRICFGIKWRRIKQ